MMSIAVKINETSGTENMALKTVAEKANFLLLGTCLPSLRHNASKIKVQRLVFDDYLLKYFRKSTVLIAYDPEKICKTGDIVLVQELPKRMTTSITHKVLEVIYPCGDVTDPITGKKVVSKLYRDEKDEMTKMFGDIESRFDYSKAPKRGWQEGRRDFSHREIYKKYHEFEDSEYADTPDSSVY